MKPFKPVNPDGIRGAALVALLEGRTSRGIVTLDGSEVGPRLFPDHDRAPRRRRSDEIVEYCSFYIKGRRFERAVRFCAWGNGGARIVRLAGQDYVICNQGASSCTP